MKKKVTLILTAALITATASSSLASVRFSDENDVPWEGAKTYIAEVADLGLMVGEENGDGTYLFRSRDKVTYFETIQLVYNILLKEKKAVKSDAVTERWTTIMKGYSVPTWAYESAAYALENKLITMTELSEYVDKNGRSTNATREGVAVIFGKAIAKFNDIDGDSEIAFNDKNLISDDAKEYVGLLSKLNILVGDNNANFNPEAYINRAEMAVVTSKTYAVITGGAGAVVTNTFEGTVTEAVVDGDNKTIEVKDSDGNVKKFKGGSDTATTYNGSSSDFMDVAVGNKVNVTYDDNGIIRVTLLNEPAASSDGTIKGTINNISSTSVAVDLSSGTSSVYYFDPSVVITFNGKLSNAREVLRSIENGNTLDVTVGLKSGKAYSVVVKGDADTVKGILTDVDKYGISVKCYYGEEKDFDFADNYVIKYEGETIKYSDLNDYLDDYAELEITASLNDRGEITRLDAEIPTDGGTVNGSSKKITDEKVSLEFSDGTTKSYQLAGTPYVTYQGDASSLSKLKNLVEDGDTLSLKIYLNNKNQVTKIDAELDDNTAGVISKLTDDYITIVTESGKSLKYYIKKSADINFTGGSSDDDLSTLEDVYISGGTEVKLELDSNNEVKKIIVYDDNNYDTYSGTLDNLTTSNFKVDGKTISYGSSTTITIDGETVAAYDLYKRAANGEAFKANVKTKDGKAMTVSAELQSMEGTLTDIQHDKISIKGKNYEATYNLIDEDNSEKELVIKINGNDRDYTINDLYSGW